MANGTLVLVRHGESRMNLVNRFTGWIDIPLSKDGVKEAQAAAAHCHRFDYDAAFTSNLERAHETLLIILSRQHRIGVFQHGDDSRYNNMDHLPAWFQNETLPIFASEALNERAYGDLQGENKDEVAKRFGEDQLFKWRRGFKDRPPGGESLEDVYRRVIPYFEAHILPRVQGGQAIVVSAHGNTLRAVIKYLEKIEDDKIPFVDLPTAQPIVYLHRKDVFTREEGDFAFDRPLR